MILNPSQFRRKLLTYFKTKHGFIFCFLANAFRFRWFFLGFLGNVHTTIRDGEENVFVVFCLFGNVHTTIRDGEEKLALPTGNYSANFRAKTEALHTAATAVSENAARTTGQVVLLPDALSVLQTLKSSRSNRETNAFTTALIMIMNDSEEL